MFSILRLRQNNLPSFINGAIAKIFLSGKHGKWSGLKGSDGIGDLQLPKNAGQRTLGPGSRQDVMGNDIRGPNFARLDQHIHPSRRGYIQHVDGNNLSRGGAIHIDYIKDMAGKREVKKAIGALI